jgi:hypothetical protein
MHANKTPRPEFANEFLFVAATRLSYHRRLSVVFARSAASLSKSTNAG